MSRPARTLCPAFAGILMILLAVPQSFAQQEITVKEWVVPTQGSAPHDIVVDGNGIVWYTAIGANKIGRFDPATGEFAEHDTSSRSSGPYAIWVDIHDNVWFSMANSHKTGRFDQNTGMLHEYDMPTPNTMSRFIYADSDGRVWFPNDVNDRIGVITLESTKSLPPERFEPKRNLQEDPVALSYDIAHRDEQDGVHTIIELALTDANDGEPVQQVAYLLQVTRFEDGSQLLTDAFYTANGTLVLDITHQGPAQISGAREEFLNAWVADPETGTVSMDLPLEPDSTYLLRVELLGTDDVHNPYNPAQVPGVDLHFDSSDSAIGEIQIVPEFPYHLVLVVSATIGIIAVMGRLFARRSITPKW